MKFEALADVLLRVTFFWEMTPCGLLRRRQRFREACCLYLCISSRWVDYHETV